MGLLWLALAVAADPFGHLAMETSPGSTWELLPRTSPDWVDLVLHDNHLPIADQLEDKSATGLMAAAATSVGGGITFVRFYLDDTSLEPRIDARDGFLLVSMVPRRGPPAAPEAPAPVDVAALIGGEVSRIPGVPPTQGLVPLLGDANANLALGAHRVEVPLWDSSPIAAGLVELAGDDDLASAEAFERYRLLLSVADTPDVRRVALWRLALASIGAGLPRDADHYLAALEREGLPGVTVPLLRANAAAARRDWDDVRTHCDAAATADLAAVETLECFAMLSVATGSPAPTETGRLLLEQSRTPRQRRLAARALLRDHRYDEAEAALMSVLSDLEGPGDPELQALLGDARFGTGDLVGAREAWEAVPHRGRFGQVARTRLTLLDLLAADPASWGGRVPDLMVRSETGGVDDADALHLVAQIARRHGDPELEAEALATMFDRRRDVARVAGVTERLLASCGRRLGQLHREERYVEEVAFYRRCWDPVLYDVVRDTTTVENAASAYSALGLPDAALDLQRAAMRMHTRDGRQDPAGLLALAELYRAADRPYEALETVAYVRGLPVDPDVASWLRIVAADAYDALDRPDDALRELSRVPPADVRGRLARVERRVRRDGCGAAIDELDALDAAGVVVGPTLVRCRLELGRGPDARAALPDGPLYPELASLSGRVAVDDEDPEPPPMPDERPPWLDALLAEEQRHAAFVERNRPR